MALDTAAMLADYGTIIGVLGILLYDQLQHKPKLIAALERLTVIVEQCPERSLRRRKDDHE